MELADLFPLFPDIDDSKFQAIVASKREFSELETEAREQVPQFRGDLFRHQKIIQRVMSEVDEMFILHEPGSGKTCTVIAVAEYFHRLIGQTPIKKMVILAFSKALRQDIKRQIICNCTNGLYETDKVKERQGPQLQAAITKALSEWYTVMSYTKFAKQMWLKYWHPSDQNDENSPVVPNEEAIERDLSGRGYWIDEFHDLRIDRPLDSIVLPVPGKSLKETEWNKEHTYKVLWTIFHLTTRRKIILSSGTPMVNFPSELLSGLNLALPVNQQFPMEYNIEGATLEEIREKVGGRISYIRSMDTGIYIEYIGEVLEGEYEAVGPDGQLGTFSYQKVIYQTEMSELQENGYQEAVDNLRGNFEEDDGRLAAYSQEFTNVLQATNVVYPDGSYGGEGYSKYIEVRDGSYVATGELREQLETIEGIKEVSCKFGDIIERAEENNGMFFVYSDFLEKSGIIFLTLCLQAQGYEEFKQSQSAFSGEQNRSFCNIESKGQDRKKLNIKPAKRYGLIVGDTSDSVRQSLIELQHSWENRHGDYLKFIIVSKVGRVGLSFKNVIYIELIDSEWNDSMIQQAKMRCIRATSHVDLLEERRSKGITQPLTVEVRLHAAITSENESINLTMYRRAEQKDRQIKRVMRKLKQLAFDCPLHHRRNIRREDADDSAECDYTVCQYRCAEPALETINVDTYDVYYLQGYLDTILEEISKILALKGGLSIRELYRQLQIEPKYIDLAIEKGVTSSRTFIDRFGFTKFLHENAGMVFLADSLDRNISYPTSYYTINLATVDPISPEEIELSLADTQVEELVQTGPLEETESIRTNILLVERALLKLRDTGQREPILDRFQNFWFELQYPQAEIQRKKAEITSNPSKHKIKVLTQNLQMLEKLQLDASGPKVYVHNLDNLKAMLESQTDYNIITNFWSAEGEYRLLMPSDKGFHRADEVETYFLNLLVQKILRERLRNVENHHVYIFEFNGKKFIRDNTFDPTGPKIDARKIRRGHACETYKPAELLQMVWDARLYPPNSQDYQRRVANMTLAQVDRQLRASPEDPTEEAKRFFLVWESMNLHKAEACEYILEQLERRGDSFRIY